MKNYLKTLAVSTLALALIMGPVVGSAFAAPGNGNGDGNGNSQNKGNSGNANKVEKVEKNTGNSATVVNAAVTSSPGNSGNSNKAKNDEKKNDSAKSNNSSSNSSVSVTAAKTSDDSTNVVVTTSAKTSLGSCTRAFGHLIAPGWIKKNGAPNVDLTNCLLPFGIAKKLGLGGGNGTTTDTTAPILSNIGFAPALTQVGITWTTDENSNSAVYWDTDATIDTSNSATNKIVVSNSVKNHSIVLTNLTSSTTYYVIVGSTDSSGNRALSGVNSFTTLATSSDITDPIISNITSDTGTSTLNVAWNTNENTTDRVYYSTILPVVLNASTTSNVSNTTATSTHSMNVTGLTSNTTYYVVIESTDAAGNVATASTFSVHTDIIPDTTAPVLSGIVALPGSSTTTVAWNTNELSTSKVFYSTVTPFDVNATTTLWVLVSTPVTSHEVVLNALSTSTVYYFKVESTDASGNTATSTQFSATTN